MAREERVHRFTGRGRTLAVDVKVALPWNVLHLRPLLLLATTAGENPGRPAFNPLERDQLIQIGVNFSA